MFFRQITIDSLSATQNPLSISWFHFSWFTLNLLLFLQNNYVYEFNILFPKSFWIHSLRPEINLNSLSASWFHYEYTTCFTISGFTKSIWMHYFFSRIHYVFREFPIDYFVLRDFSLNSLSFTRFHFEFTIFSRNYYVHTLFYANSLSVSQRHLKSTIAFAKPLWIRYEITLKPLWNQYEFTICFATCL